MSTNLREVLATCSRCVICFEIVYHRPISTKIRPLSSRCGLSNSRTVRTHSYSFPSDLRCISHVCPSSSSIGNSAESSSSRPSARRKENWPRFSHVHVQAGSIHAFNSENILCDNNTPASQPIPIPSYLIAIAAGNVRYRAFPAVEGKSWTTGVWAEPEVVDAAYFEFSEDTVRYTSPLT
jgi:hypothetical protein